MDKNSYLAGMGSRAIAVCSELNQESGVLEVHVTAVEFTEQILFRRSVLGNRSTHPGGLIVVLQSNILAADTAAPNATAETARHRHAIAEGSGVTNRLSLSNHYSADRRSQRQSINVVVIKRVNPAGMPLAADLIKGRYHFKSLIEAAVILEYSQHCAELLT